MGWLDKVAGRPAVLRSVSRLIGDLIESAEDEAVSFPAILGGGPSRPYATALYIAF